MVTSIVGSDIIAHLLKKTTNITFFNISEYLSLLKHCIRKTLTLKIVYLYNFITIHKSIHNLH